MIQKWILDYLINQVVAYILRWLDSNQPTQAVHDPKPSPIIKSKPKLKGKYAPPDLTPGHWNKETGSYNPMK